MTGLARFSNKQPNPWSDGKSDPVPPRPLRDYVQRCRSDMTANDLPGPLQSPSPRPTPSHPVRTGPNPPRPPVPIGTGWGRGEPTKTPSPPPQHWRCSQCSKTYTSPLPLKIPPVHRCAPTTGGTPRLRNFTLEATDQ